MKYLLSWVCEFLPKKPPEAKAILEALDRLGLSVTHVENLTPRFQGVVVAEVREVTKHPNADRLSLAKVHDGSTLFNVVCGAPNLKAGQKVAFAKEGAVLESATKGRIAIKKTTIRNEVSEGMICSSSELGLDDERDGILVLPEDWTTGKALAGYVGDDCVFELELPFHRWDLTSHMGLARELAIYFWREHARRLPQIMDTQRCSGDANLQISIASDAAAACNRYMGGLMKNVKVAASPFWMRRRLSSLGLKPINNIVDVTNYVLLETGQPLHAFDYSKLEGNCIEVRWAKPGEVFDALDGNRRMLHCEHLVIADAKKPAALAGVMGAQYSKVTEDTKDILLECAWFARSAVRRSARSLGLRTDSSARFEKETDIHAIPDVFWRAVSLLRETAGGYLACFTDIYPQPPKPATITFKTAAIGDILGFQPETEEMFKVLRPLCEEMRQMEDKSAWTCKIASWRSDLRLPEDLAEEVLRHLGTEKVPGSAQHEARVSIPRVRPQFTDQALKALSLGDDLKNLFLGLGFCEVVNYPLEAAARGEQLFGSCAEAIEITNPVSEDLNMLRPSMLAGLWRNWQLNRAHGRRLIRLQETGYWFSKQAPRGIYGWAAISSGPIYRLPHWQDKKEASFAFWALLGAVEEALRLHQVVVEHRGAQDLGKAFHPGRQTEFYVEGQAIGFAAELATAQAREAEPEHGVAFAQINLAALADVLSKRGTSRYRALPAAPRVQRDLSVIVPKSTVWADLEACLKRALGNALETVYPFDIFMIKGKKTQEKSVALRLHLSARDKTYTNEEIQALLNQAIETLEKEIGAKIRGKNG